MKIIDGKKIAEEIKDNIVREIVKMNKGQSFNANRRPNLAIILIGEREDSRLYVDMKMREAKKVGIDTHLYKCSDEISEKEVIEMIGCLNDDELIDAILVQLPLADNFDTDKIIKSINPEKDVDRFHPENLKILQSTCDHDLIMSPVFSTVLEMLRSIEYDLKGKRACILCNSDIFGKSLEKVLECEGAEVRVVKPDNNFLDSTTQADVLISAIGRPKFIKKEMIKNNSIIIDIGITKDGKKVIGDVDFHDVDDKADYISPVPGGVGPMTIAMLFKNTLALYNRRKKL